MQKSHFSPEINRNIWVGKDVMSLPDRIEVINNIAVPTTKKQTQSFIGLLNTTEICRNIYPVFYHPHLASFSNKSNGIEVKNDFFIEKLDYRDISLSYPNFNKTFVIYNDTSIRSSY